MSFFQKLKNLLFKAAVFSTALLYSVTSFGCASPPDAHSDNGSDSGISLYASAADDGSVSPSVSARSAVLIDADSGALICSKNPDERLPMASTTKIMTALVAIESMELDRRITIPREAVGVEGSSIYLYEGETLTLKDLLYALLLESANDAAAAIAIAVGGSIDGFADMMNQKARELVLENTSFKNPHGLDSDGHYTTARELGIIASHAIKNDIFREIVSTKKTTIPLNGAEGVRLLINHNRLLKSYEGAIGIKTGYTKKSGRCLVSAAERDGLTLICVTLSSPNDWKDHAALLDFGFASYESRLILGQGELKYTLPVVGSDKEYVTLTNRDEIRMTFPKSAKKAKYTIEAPRFAFAPLSEGDVVGKVICTVDGIAVAEAPLYAAYSATKTKDRQSILEKIASLFKK